MLPILFDLSFDRTSSKSSRRSFLIGLLKTPCNTCCVQYVCQVFVNWNVNVSVQTAGPAPTRQQKILALTSQPSFNDFHFPRRGENLFMLHLYKVEYIVYESIVQWIISTAVLKYTVLVLHYRKLACSVSKITVLITYQWVRVRSICTCIYYM